jgi:hypothetical protein
MQEEILTIIHDIPIKRNFVLNLPYNVSLKSRAKALRKAGNFSEVVFWKEVRRPLQGKIHKKMNKKYA